MKNATLGLPLHVIAARARPFIDRSRHRLIYFRKRGVASFTQFSENIFSKCLQSSHFRKFSHSKISTYTVVKFNVGQ